MTDLPGSVVVECPGTEPVIEGLGVHVARAATQYVVKERQKHKDRDPPQVQLVTIKTQMTLFLTQKMNGRRRR
jgi:hypothetical protein